VLGLVFLCRGELGAHVADEVTYQDDIVAQLRRAAVFSMIPGNRQMLETAAAEIERLRQHQCIWGSDHSGPHYSEEYLASLPKQSDMK